MTTGDGKSWVVPFAAGAREDADLLGGKGANLAELTKLGVPVPPGLVITTQACRHYLEHGELPDGLLTEVTAELDRIGAALGRGFGDPDAPLLVSVRSGAPVSMPGMMDTILNVGLSPAGLAGFGRLTGSEAGAADCMARLEEMYGGTTGQELPVDPHAQLRGAIAAVFDSWGSKRAQLYRRFHRIPDTGTAVVVQAMVFGNIGEPSGTGVAFTRDPSTGDPELFGEYLAQGQGEDVVNGSRNVGDLEDLRAADPEAYASLAALARIIEEHFADMCELEFTLERGRLWILQARSGQRSAIATVRIAVQLVHEGKIDRSEALARVDLDAVDEAIKPTLDRAAVEAAQVLTEGFGSSPGLATGAVVLDSAAAKELSADGRHAILVRTETTPKDLDGMIASDGLLTTRGGRTSHAAVVARGLGKTCVCGAEEIVVDERAKALRIGARVVAEGETISIDGDGGLVILGAAPTVAPELPAELAELRGWAAAAGGATRAMPARSG